ncbi:hypothetical protein AVE30378_01055 [Achromobacter veterisilvae]|uniref:Uncharacterized protein n=1 Tax=Achromobacter veterisilvae TaxID=2069367 RepID=A0A446C9A7_9BURK|nr:hypothetical protein [Achromobacter veterisilvae]SSW64353.1 hypothetical protein AVE30378_01055 [Achromobacter veterisilvae]
MNHNQIGQFAQASQPSMASSPVSAQQSSGEILDALEALASTIAKCEFAAQELMSRLGPVLSCTNDSQACGTAPFPQPDTQIARIVLENTHRVRALMTSIEDAGKRLALP